MDTPLVRMLDACINRATEGLRVVEDFARFVLDDPYLTSLCKDVRHDLTSALTRLPATSRWAARDTLQDVGTELATAEEYRREDVAQVCHANFKRIQQSLRSLEEYGKLLDGQLARRLESLRYRTYTLEKSFGLRQRSAQKLEAARLYALVDGRESEAALERFVAMLANAGVDAIQLRAKELPDDKLLGRARTLVHACRDTKTLAFVNDRADIAILAGADGVHLGQDDLSVKDARTLVGTQMLIGVSTHSIEQARAAVLHGASYIGVGPVFPSSTKEFEQFPGLELVRAVAEEIRLPWFAIGGIRMDNVQRVVDHGARRIAVSSALAQAPDPSVAATTLLGLLENARIDHA